MLTISQNRFLSALSPDEYPRLFENLALITLELKQVLIEPGQKLDYSYFPITAVLSFSVGNVDDLSSEVAIIGRRDLIGLSNFLGCDQAQYQAIVVAPGDVLQIRSDVLMAEVEKSPQLRDYFLKYTYKKMFYFTRNITCKAHHTISQQLARWLLSIYDQIEGNQLPLTHPFIAQRFGVRRASITEAAIAFQNAGYISYQRGNITILDPDGLRSVACTCYDAVNQIYAQTEAIAK